VGWVSNSGTEVADRFGEPYLGELTKAQSGMPTGAGRKRDGIIDWACSGTEGRSSVEPDRGW